MRAVFVGRRDELPPVIHQLRRVVPIDKISDPELSGQRDEVYVVLTFRREDLEVAFPHLLEVPA